MGKLIVFEGIDGAGKTSIINLVAAELKKSGRSVIVLAEPGTTPIGSEIRTLLKSGIDRSKLSEVFLFMASRADLCDKIHQYKKEYDYVLLDRFVDSTIAYQGFGNGIPVNDLELLNNLSTGGLTPDQNFFIHISLEEAEKRRSNLEFDGDKFEIDKDFAKRVYDGYQQIIKEKPYFVITNIDLQETVDTVFRNIIGVG